MKKDETNRQVNNKEDSKDENLNQARKKAFCNECFPQPIWCFFYIKSYNNCTLKALLSIKETRKASQNKKQKEEAKTLIL